MDVCLAYGKRFQEEENVSELGRTLAVAVSCWSLAVEAGVRSSAISVSGGRSGVGRGYTSTRVLGCDYHFFNAPYSFVYRNSVWPQELRE